MGMAGVPYQLSIGAMRVTVITQTGECGGEASPVGLSGEGASEEL